MLSNASFPSISILTFWEEVHLCSPPERVIPPWRLECHKLFEILVQGRVVASLSFINSFNHLFPSVWTLALLLKTYFLSRQEKQRERLSLGWLLQNDCNADAELIQDQEMEASLGGVSQAETGVQGFEPCSTTFLGHNQGVGWKVEELGHEQMFIWDTSAADRLNALCLDAIPKILVYLLCM